jgi:UDP-glucose 4-epimerase
MVIFGSGAQTRDFTYVGDTARGILLAGTADGVVGETMNIGQGRETSIADLAQQVAAVVGRPSEIVHTDPRPGDVQRLLADASKARRLLGFEPEVTLAEGIARARDWYLGLAESPSALLEAETLRNWERPVTRS